MCRALFRYLGCSNRFVSRIQIRRETVAVTAVFSTFALHNAAKLGYDEAEKANSFALFSSRFALTLQQRDSEVRLHLGIKSKQVCFILLSVCTNFATER